MNDAKNFGDELNGRLPPMDIVLHSLGMPFNGETIYKQSLGGSETAAYYQARELAKRGHRVSLFTGSQEEGSFDGVTYLWAGNCTQQATLGERFEFYTQNTPHDVLIIQRHPYGFHKSYQSKINIWQLHDLALYRTASAMMHGLYQLDAVTCVSRFHAEQVKKVYGIREEILAVVPNGVDLALYETEAKRPEGFDGKSLLLYQSRPERGLEHLLRPGGIMERLRDTNAHLLVVGYENTQPQMVGYYNQLKAWAQALPNVTYLGALTKQQLAALQKSCDLLVYPTNGFEEVSPLRGDAVIDMPGGRETIENLWKQNRRDFWVWSWSHAEKRMVLAKANKVIRTRQCAEMVTIRMRPKAGCKAKCETTLTLTPDHEVMLRDGAYVRADQLKPGDSLMPFGRSAGFGRFKKSNGDTCKYWYVSRKNLGDRIAEHRYVAEMMLGRKLKCTEIVDHIDGDTSNNDPSNLQVWGSHSEHLTDHWQRLEQDEANARKAERTAVIHAYHASLSPDEMTTVKRRAALTRWRNEGAGVENHVVVTVDHADNADAYCMEVEGTHNFIANGIAVHNCITAMESMAAGLPFLASECGALPETCKGSGAILVPLKDGCADEDEFVRQVKKHANDGAALLGYRSRQLFSARSKTWDKAVDALEALIIERLSRYQRSPAALVRHCIEHSDIALAEHVLLEHAFDDAITERTRSEIRGLYAFRDSDATYRAHYAFHQGEYYDSHEEKVLGEDVSQTTRFRGVAMFLDQEMRLRPGQDDVRVLDFGCAHGHYLIPFARAFPQAQFTGVDVSVRAVGAAMKWVQREGLGNVRLLAGGQELLGDERKTLLRTVMRTDFDADPIEETNDDGTVSLKQPQYAEEHKFDVILAGEILEHVIDPIALLEQFRSVLNPGGAIIVTTPIGRWEWTGTEAFRTGREHLHHFDKDDILEICTDNGLRVPEDLIFGPAGNDLTGRCLGSYIWRVRPSAPFRPVDYARKIKRLAPRQTVSACLIVKDGERTLRKCIESVIDWVDEVIIAIDPTTRDRTREIGEQLVADYKHKPILVMDGVEALKEGFAAARNRTIEAASGDWILWLDADEEVQQPWNLWQYLRPSHHDGIGFPQVHYSCNPPQVLTTDYPCRLFRNRVGIRFHGAVHEHPEIEQGKAIPTAVIKHDLQFLHCGYVDEAVRRKRFMRNLPLLHKDRRENPERGLNRFLWLRDLAQSLMFEHEQTSGVVVEGQRERAWEGIALFGEMLDKDQTRMCIDAMPYYGHCVQTAGASGFESELNFSALCPIAPDLAARANFKGTFHSRDYLFRLTRKIQEEATRHYEDRYL